MPRSGPPNGVTSPTSGQQIMQDPRLFLGAGAVLCWFVALTMTDFTHDALGIAAPEPSAHPATHIAYELSSGYALGFIAAIAIALLGGMLRTDDSDETQSLHPLLRQLAALALFIVALACIIGAAVHNAEGITLLYDIAFATGLIAVFAGVVPLHQHLAPRRQD